MIIISSLFSLSFPYFYLLLYVSKGTLLAISLLWHNSSSCLFADQARVAVRPPRGPFIPLSQWQANWPILQESVYTTIVYCYCCEESWNCDKCGNSYLLYLHDTGTYTSWYSAALPDSVYSRPGFVILSNWTVKCQFKSHFLHPAAWHLEVKW